MKASRADQRLAPTERVREILSPEGVPLHIQVADSGTRAIAFLTDMFLVFLMVMAIAILAQLAMSGGGMDSGAGSKGEGLMGAVVQLAIFFLWNFYFIYFELRWQGSTPGKRWQGIRVIDAEGGPLTANAVFARNLVRNVELYVPLSIVINPEQITGGAPGWLRFISVLWALILLFLPLFNRDRLRVGDLIAGTVVVVKPKTALLYDVSADRTVKAADHTFTDKQLGIYGIYELQVLENLLRSPDTMDRINNINEVADRIRKKIKFQNRIANSEQFLRDFYAALRDRLERRMLFGRKKQDKHSASDTLH